MRRKALIVLLALGTVGGYASGFASMRWCGQQRRAAFEQHVAKVCVDAARESDASARSQGQPPVQAATPVIVNVSPVAATAASPSPAPAAAPAQPE